MKRFLTAFLMSLIGSSFFTVQGSAQHSGLWVGTATLKYVSEVNKQYSDLSFDLGLVGVKAHDTLISQGTLWKHEGTGADLGSVWVDPDPTVFDDSAWSEDTSPLEESLWDTTVGPPTTVYFRKHIQVADPSLYSDLRIHVWRDDGVVLYLNGEEIFRNNMPTGSVDFDTFALSGITVESPLLEFSLPATLLEEGTNVLAAEIHQAEGSTDLLYDLELTAALKDPPTTTLIETADATDPPVWKYHQSQYGPGAVSENDPMDADWHSNTYVTDSSWSEDHGQFEYDDNVETTQITDKSAPTVYFRKEFTGNTADFTHLRVFLLRDDGAVVYVNGDEILRSNMPEGMIGHSTAPVKALGPADENRYIVVEVEAPDLTGTDLLAVELHQHPAELAGSTGGGTPLLTRTSAPFDLRLLFHVDEGSQVRLLKEVIQMSKPNPQPGEDPFVLLTDHTLAPNYTGVAIRDGVPVGRRLSAVGFDFAGTSLECSGGVSLSGTVGCSINLGWDRPTNPFFHRYHPDHDNWDERYENVVEEAYAVTRQINLEFNGRYPPDEDLPERAVPPAGWGSDLLGGYYSEKLTGLHKEEIKVQGPFIMRRVVTTDTLTP